MKRFWKDNTGSALILSIFIIFILVTLSAVVYGIMTVYSKYQACETEVQRAAFITVDKNILNANVRDLILDVPAEAAEESFFANLTGMGWMLEDGSWNRYEDGKIVYSLEDMIVDIEDKTLSISATIVVPLPWAIGDLSKVHLPINERSSVLYID